MRVSRTKKYLNIKIPLKAKRFNPYTDEYVGEMNNISGLICNHKNGLVECGFVQMIDMQYKGKDDQWTDYIVVCDEESEDFKKLCEKLNIGLIEIGEKV